MAVEYATHTASKDKTRQDKDSRKTRGVLQQEPRDCGCEETIRGTRTRLWAVGRDCGRTVGGLWIKGGRILRK